MHVKQQKTQNSQCNPEKEELPRQKVYGLKNLMVLLKFLSKSIDQFALLPT